MNDRKKMYRTIQQISFVLYETALYLDTHPNCRRALEYFSRYNVRLQELTAKYEELYGPITIFSQNCSDTWQWATQPWPWEYECQ